jgi:hypothetical protein
LAVAAMGDACKDVVMAATQGPHELTFVVDAPASGTISRHPGFDVHRPEGVDQQLPAAVIVPGPSPAQYPFRPRDWPTYQGYSQLLAGRGVLGVVVDQPFHGFTEWPASANDLAEIVESVRAMDGVDANRIAVWAFSGAAMLVGEWLAQSPDWLRCLALTYPMWLPPDGDTPTTPAEVVAPGRPLLLTRVGRELPDRQKMVDRFMARAHTTGTDVRVIDVPDGQHGFDALDHTEQSRRAVIEATELVVGHLLHPLD